MGWLWSRQECREDFLRCHSSHSVMRRHVENVPWYIELYNYIDCILCTRHITTIHCAHVPTKLYAFVHATGGLLSVYLRTSWLYLYAESETVHASLQNCIVYTHVTPAGRIVDFEHESLHNRRMCPRDTRTVDCRRHRVTTWRAHYTLYGLISCLTKATHISRVRVEASAQLSHSIAVYCAHATPDL